MGTRIILILKIKNKNIDRVQIMRKERLENITLT